jgi:hypothetical protein
MLLLKERSKDVAEGLLALGQMSAAGIGADYFFQKSVIMLSWQLFSLNAIDEGLSVLSLVTAFYVATVMPRHLEEDSAFRMVAGRIANLLVDVGEVRPFYEFDSTTTMAQTKADA